MVYVRTFLAIDTILTSCNTHFWLVKLKDVGKYATKGGFVDMGETTEEAVVRELNGKIIIYLFKVSSDPVLFGLCGGPVRGCWEIYYIGSLWKSSPARRLEISAHAYFNFHTFF